MNISEILKNWEAAAQAERDSRNVSARIAIDTAAKINVFHSWRTIVRCFTHVIKAARNV